MRLKSAPEDFVVHEATDLRIRQKPAPYRVYLLEKKGWNTADALSAIARQHGIPATRFAYGGKKDRHAHTFQYVTAMDPRDLSLATPGYRLKAVGYTTEPMGPGRVLANRFDLTVRDLSEKEAGRLLGNLPAVKAEGFPNYFDDQRFGSYDPERGFIAEHMLAGRWEQALAIALTAPYPGEKRAARERKAALRERWGDWDACREIARTAFEQRCFDLLRRHPGGFKAALATARREELEMWLSAYQSFLWNEILRRLVGEGPAVSGAAGPYVFGRGDRRLRGMRIPLPGRGMRFDDPAPALALEEILRERRLRPSQLEEEVLPGLALRSSLREAFVRPESVWAEGPHPDDRYPGRLKLLLRFTLPRGSYATMLIKRLTV